MLDNAVTLQQARFVEHGKSFKECSKWVGKPLESLKEERVDLTVILKRTFWQLCEKMMVEWTLEEL